MDFKVADLSLAEYGRKEIELAEHEMPGLVAMRERYGEEPAARGRPHRRFAAHDDPDRRAHRDPRRARRRRALGHLQHLLHPGPRRRGGRRRARRHRRQPQGHPRLRLEGRVAGRVLGRGREGLRLPPRAARTCCSTTAATSRCCCTWASSSRRPVWCPRRTAPTTRSSRRCCASWPARSRASRSTGPHRQGHQGRLRGDHHRRPAPLRPVPRGHAALPGDQRQRLGHQVASSTTSTAAATR